VTPADLRAWQKAMGISGREAARRLGVAPGTYQDWVTGTSRTTGKPIQISRLVSLACAALAAGIDERAQRQAVPRRDDGPLPRID
jgi:transcriptional regulator with XRE-family HTH domain